MAASATELSERSLPALAVAIVAFTGALASAAPTQMKFFQSIHDNVGPTFDVRRALPYLVAAVAAGDSW